MSSQHPSRPTAVSPRPGPAHAAPAGGGTASFDPLKLLQKYKYLLVSSLFAGAVFGVVAHFFFLFFFPLYKSTVLFVCAPAETDIEIITPTTIDEDEMARFIGTQVATIKGELVMTAVLEDARLQAEAPSWYDNFVRGGNFDIVKAYEELEDTISATAIANTYLIELSVQVRDRSDAAGLVRLIKDNYLRILRSGNSTSVTRRKEAIRQAIKDADATVKELTDRKNRLVKDQVIGTVRSENSAEADMLNLVNAQILSNQQQIEAYSVILADDEAQLKRNTPINYDQSLRNSVEQYPQILTLKQRVIDLQSGLLSMQADGIKPDHRSYKQVLNQIEATERKLEDTREQLLLEAFESRIAATRMVLSQLRAQIEDLVSEQEELVLHLNELTKTSEEIEEINRQLENALELKATQSTYLSELGVSAGLATADRVSVSKPENIPDRPSFPVLYIMIPAGMFLITALTAAGVIVFEMLDQRVKSAADIALLPRTPILGIIPDAAEDPAQHAALETLFSDSPNSVLAEHFRQLRTRVLKSMGGHDHKTLLVVGAMPGSGATSVTTNLAQACVSAGKKTLIIDTNFRRARIHTAFGRPDAPGLAELLAGQKALDECVQSTTSGPDILAAGARNLRVVERLGADMMGQVLAQAAAEYDIVLLDVAPAIVAGDAMALCAQVDATMLVARAMSEKRGQIARLKNELSDTRAEFIGVLVNGVKSAAGGYMRKNIRTSHQYHAAEAPQAS